MKISKKPFSLDPNLANLKDNPTTSVKQQNWNVVGKELKKFGVRVDGDKRQKIVDGRFQYINDILNKLFDFDNGGGVHSQRLQDGNISEMNYAGGADADKDNSFLGDHLRKDDLRGGDSIANVSMEVASKKRESNQNQILLGAPIKKAQLDPITNNVSQSIQQKLQQQQSPNKQIPTAVTSVKALSKTPSIQKLTNNTSANLEALIQLDQNKDFTEADSTLEFILLSLSKNLQMKPKQAAALLSNNHKYLILISVKGMKGGDFQKLLSWFQDIYSNTKLLLSLIDHEKESNAMSSTLNIIKCGLFSSNIDICIACSKVLQKIALEINNDSSSTELSGLAWDWFISNKVGSNNQGGSNIGVTDFLDDKTLPTLEDVKVPDFSSSIIADKQDVNEFGQSGLAACVYAMKRHPADYMQHALLVMVQFAKNNYFELFSHQLIIYYPGKAEYLTLCHDIFIGLNGETSTQVAKEALLYSGVVDSWVDYAIRISDFDVQNSPNDRISALSLLIGLWEGVPDKIEEKGDVAQAILTMLKRGCRDRCKILRIASCELMFKLLQSFALNRNHYAPIIYKSLAFLLIEFYLDIQIREQMLKNFTQLFRTSSSIPITILCEPLIKQIQINDNQLTPQFCFNTFDYEFFLQVVNHKRANAAIAIQIGEEMIRVAQTDLFYRNCAIQVILAVIFRFSKDSTMHNSFSSMFKDVLKVIEGTEKQKQQQADDLKKKRQQQQLNLQNSMTQKNTLSPYRLKKIQEEEKQKQQEDEQARETANLARQTKERLIVNLFSKLITALKSKQLGGLDMMLQDLRTQLLTTYTNIEKTIKVKSRALNFLLNLFGEDVPKMLQYFVDIELPKIKQKELEESVKYQTQLEKSFLGKDAGSESINSREVVDVLQIVPFSQEISVTGSKQQKPNQQTEKALKEIERIKLQSLERTEKKQIEEELKKQQQQKLIQQAKKAVDQRKHELGVASKTIGKRNQSEDGRQQKAEKINNSLGDIKIRKIREVVDEEGDNELAKNNSMMIVPYREDDNQRLFNSEDDRKDMSFMNPNKNANTLKKTLNKIEEVKLFDIRLEEQKDQDAVRFFLQKNLKILRAFFTKYQNSGPLKNNKVSETFDKMQEKNSIISSAEIIKFLKDQKISNVQISKDDVINYMRLINLEILKKKQNGSNSQSSLQILDFEGFVEFILQLAVHLYSFNDDHPPVEYLQKLFDHFKKIAIMNGNSQAGIFEDNQFNSKVWGLGGSAQTDSKVIAELQRRVDNDRYYQLPEGYSKVLEKEVVSNYKLPDYLLETGVVSESQVIAIEVLDQLIYEQYKVHFIEPMSEVKSIYKVKANPKQQQKNQELYTNEQKDLNKSPVKAGWSKASNPSSISPIRSIPSKPVSRKNNLSNSVDIDPIDNGRRSTTIAKTRPAGKSLSQRTLSPALAQNNRPKEVKPLLGVNLKIEVAKAPQQNRQHVLETAYVLEEILTAVEYGMYYLPERQQMVKQTILNRVQQDRIQKEQEEMRFKEQRNNKINQRQAILKEKLRKMKDEKEAMLQEDINKKNQQREIEQARQKQKEEAKKKYFSKIAQENEEKKQIKKEEQEQKKREKEIQDKQLEEQKKKELQQIMKVNKREISLDLKKGLEEQKKKKEEDEKKKQLNEQKLKQKQAQNAQKHAELLQKAKEQKDKQRQAYYDFIDEPNVDALLKKYAKGMQAVFNQYCKFGETALTEKMSYKAYMQMGSKLYLTPQLLTSQDYIYVFKTIMRGKKDLQGLQFEQNGAVDIDTDSSKLDVEEFKEALIKIACISKLKLGGLKQKNLDQQNQEQQQQDTSIPQKVKLATDLEKKFEYQDMTEQTLLALFKLIGIKILKDTTTKGGAGNTINNQGKQNNLDNSLDNLDDF